MLSIHCFKTGRRDVPNVLRDKVNLAVLSTTSINLQLKTRTLSSHRASRYPRPGVSLRHATGKLGITCRISGQTVARTRFCGRTIVRYPRFLGQSLLHMGRELVTIIHFSKEIPQGVTMHRLLGLKSGQTRANTNTHIIELGLQTVMKASGLRNFSLSCLSNASYRNVSTACYHQDLRSVQFAMLGSRPVISASFSAKNGHTSESSREQNCTIFRRMAGVRE